MPPSGQSRPECAVIVDLAVEHDPDRLVFVRDRLAPAGQVNDGQAPKAKPKPRLDVSRSVVWAAVCNGMSHAQHLACLHAPGIENAYKAAHGPLTMVWLRNHPWTCKNEARQGGRSAKPG